MNLVVLHGEESDIFDMGKNVGYVGGYVGYVWQQLHLLQIVTSSALRLQLQCQTQA